MDIKFCIFILIILGSGRVFAAPEERIIDGVTYHLLQTEADLIRVLWTDDDGAPLRTFPKVAAYFQSKKLVVDTLMNGGIYEPGGIPSGLLVQDGRMLRPVNRDEGKGNFFLKPNGIFLISADGATVIDTEEYPLKGIEVRYAVQSGPLLLRQGRVHPSFNANSVSRLHRNGVGVLKSGEVVFVMTNLQSPKFPNLFEFAELFRGLGCEDALFLDGDISQMASGAEMMKLSNHFGSIIAIMARE